MKRVFVGLLAVLLLLVVAAAGIYLSGSTMRVIGLVAGPRHGWDLSRKAPAPDYADASAWAARPGAEGLAGMVPAGVAATTGDRPVDVFFIHPTGYLNGGDWNSPLNPKSRTEENTQWMMANQASAYNGCCNVYAPRYREASIFRYLAAPPDVAEKAMAFAYADVEKAFRHYMAHDNGGRPFIIASHSQGTSHALTLIQRQIDGTPLASRMVAAYIIGSRVTNADVDALRTVHACSSATDTGCIVHWATWGEDGGPDPVATRDLLCVNPLTWQRNGGRAPAALHKGGVPQSGSFSVRLWGDDAARGISYPALGAPVRAHTWAMCRDGVLWVADQAGTPFDGLDMGRRNYHGLDYPLFHMDIRENSSARVAAFLARTTPR